MRSIAHTALVFIALLAPAPTYALSDASYTLTTPGISSQSSQFFTTGVFGMPFGGGFGLGGYSSGCANSIYCIAGNVIYIINSVLVPVLFAISFIVFLYGITRAYIFSAGDPEKVKEGHKIILWGLIGFAVMVSIWGLVNVVSNTFGLQGSYAPFLPMSPSPFLGPAPR